MLPIFAFEENYLQHIPQSRRTISNVLLHFAVSRRTISDSSIILLFEGLFKSPICSINSAVCSAEVKPACKIPPLRARQTDSKRVSFGNRVETPIGDRFLELFRTTSSLLRRSSVYLFSFFSAPLPHHYGTSSLRGAPGRYISSYRCSLLLDSGPATTRPARHSFSFFK